MGNRTDRTIAGPESSGDRARLCAAAAAQPWPAQPVSTPLPDGDHQPVTQPMTIEQAMLMQNRTDGRLRAFQHDNGRWYCYDLVAELRGQGFIVPWGA